MYQGIFFPDQNNVTRNSPSLLTFVPTANLQKWRAAKEASAGITQLLLSVMVNVEQIDDIEPVHRSLAVI